MFPTKEHPSDSVIIDKYGLSPQKRTGIIYIMSLQSELLSTIDIIAYKRSFASKVTSQYGLSPSNVTCYHMPATSSFSMTCMSLIV